jgi:hypothetical protein
MQMRSVSMQMLVLQLHDVLDAMSTAAAASRVAVGHKVSTHLQHTVDGDCQG